MATTKKNQIFGVDRVVVDDEVFIFIHLYDYTTVKLYLSEVIWKLSPDSEFEIMTAETWHTISGPMDDLINFAKAIGIKTDIFSTHSLV